MIKEPTHIRNVDYLKKITRGELYTYGYNIYDYSTEQWIPYYQSINSLTGTFTGTFVGDGSGLTGVAGSGGDYLSLSGGVLTGPVTGTFVGDGAGLTGIVAGAGSYLPLSGGILTDGVTGTHMEFATATGFADESTIGYTAGGKLEVLAVPYDQIVYPFGLDSQIFSVSDSVEYRFLSAKSSTGTGTINSTSISWNLDDNYAIAGNGVDSLSASFYKTIYDYQSHADEKNYNIAISPGDTTEIFTDLTITCSGTDQDNILNVGSYDSLYFYTICQVGDSTHYDWLGSNNPEERSASTKRFVLPSFTLTSIITTLIDSSDINNDGNSKLSAYYRESYGTYTPTYTEDSLNVYIWFIVPDNHAAGGATIYQNTALGWNSVTTVSAGDVVIGNGSHLFTYKAFRTSNLMSPVDSYNEQYRLYWD